MADALELSPQRVLVELGDFASSFNGRRPPAVRPQTVALRRVVSKAIEMRRIGDASWRRFGTQTDAAKAFGLYQSEVSQIVKDRSKASGRALLYEARRVAAVSDPPVATVEPAPAARRWAPMETGVSVRVAAARLARGAKRGAQYYVIRGKETVDTTEDFDAHNQIMLEENNDWDSDNRYYAEEDVRAMLLDQILGDHLALAVGTLVEDLPHMRRRLGDAHPEVLAFEGHLGHLRAALRAREASRPATLCTIYVQALTNVPPNASVLASARVSASARAIVSAFSGQKLCLKVRPGDTVLSLKQKIRDVRIQGYSTNIPLERQRLIIRGRQLVDGKRLYESNVFDGTTVHLVLRPPPGGWAPGGWCSKWWGE